MTWHKETIVNLIHDLLKLRASLTEHELSLSSYIERADPSYRPSAKNFAHYLALRQGDCRGLQEYLDHLGLSSLGRAESSVLANLDKIITILCRLADEPAPLHTVKDPTGIQSARKLLKKHTDELLGPEPTGRDVRIMVTLPSSAADDFGLVRQLVESGMDIARINCAHDDHTHWEKMTTNVRRAAVLSGRSVRVLMDLAGPKLRTGSVAQEPVAIKLQPSRNRAGKVISNARICLVSDRSSLQRSTIIDCVGVSAKWLKSLSLDDHIDFTDTAGEKRCLVVRHRDHGLVIASCGKTARLGKKTRLRRRTRDARPRASRLSFPSSDQAALHLKRGDHLCLTRDGTGREIPFNTFATTNFVASIACTLPEVFSQVKLGERVWFDDGRIGGVIRGIELDTLDVEITHARDKGELLRGDKGINLPDSALDLPALTVKDLSDLPGIAKLADLVGLSFVQRVADVDYLRSALKELGTPDLGIVLKIETRLSFSKLPELLYSVMTQKAAGVMIARGDLAVECGYERMAEVQEEILWAAEAAHVPVIWATQVLDALAKTGVPSRAEISDAAMGERAECVMLNKGPHINEAIRTLNNILIRMQTHQAKKRYLLRPLRAWTL